MVHRPALLAGFALAAVGIGFPQAASPQASAPTPIPIASPWAPSGTGARWVVDVVHSQIDFRVRHLIGRVRGTFTDWYAMIVTPDDDWRHGSVNVTVQTSSLTTGNSYRDSDLRSARFFAVDRYPQIAFEGAGIVATDSTVFLSGTLSIKGHHHPVTLKGVNRGVATDAEGHQRMAFEASVVVDRRDYGMEWNQVFGSNTLVGNEVEITVSIEAVRIN